MIYDVAIIGAGPAGIGTAIDSSKAGLTSILFEKSPNILATFRTFYKAGKRVDVVYKKQLAEVESPNVTFTDGTKESAIEQLTESLKRELTDSFLAGDTALMLRTEIEKVIKEGDVFTLTTTNGEKFKSYNVVVSIGKMGAPNKPSYPIPSEIKKRVFFNANSIEPGDDILIVGGGNSAVEYATSLSSEAKVTLNYRKKEFSRINEENAALLKGCVEAGTITPKFGVDIEGLEEDDGRCKVNFADGTTATYDKIIYAIGGAIPTDFMKKCGLILNDKGIPNVDDNYQSEVEHLYVAGDLLFKSGASITIALNQGHRIANALKDYRDKKRAL